jgi:hypothetical protein
MTRTVEEIQKDIDQTLTITHKNNSVKIYTKQELQDLYDHAVAVVDAGVGDEKITVAQAQNRVKNIRPILS